MPPIVAVITFTYLNRARILPIPETGVPYPVYVLLGITVWQVFATGLTACTQSLVSAGSFISRINFSREALVLAAFGQSLFEFLIRLILVAVVFAWFHTIPKWTVVFVPVVLIPLALMTLGCGFILALANGAFRDIGNLISIVMTFLMFLTPVVYPPPTEWPHTLINYVNPVSPFIIATHDLTTKGTLTQPVGLIVGSVIGVVVLLAGWRIFHLAIPRIVERI
jgi:lipopolysaccharide transport system permease protein